MSQYNVSWQFLINGVLMGDLYLDHVDQPFFFCDFEPTPEFAEFTPLFDEELRLLNAQAIDEWMVAYARIEALQPCLSGVEEIHKFILHIEGNTAWFRY